jgi:uncharacterized protein (TIGR04255 family)
MDRVHQAAPIIAAVVEFRFDDDLPNPLIQRIAAKVAKGYAERTNLRTSQIEVNPALQVANFLPPIDMVKLSSKDQTEVFSVGAQACSIEQLSPYPGWSLFFARLARDWNLIDKLLRKRKITRIGVRYINRIDLPLSVGRDYPGEYLNISIGIPQQLANSTHVALNYQAEYGPRPFKIILNTGFADSPIPKMHSIVLDIDVISEKNVPQSTEEIFAMLGEIRQIKNEIFEESITEYARRKFAGD